MLEKYLIVEDKKGNLSIRLLIQRFLWNSLGKD